MKKIISTCCLLILLVGCSSEETPTPKVSLRDEPQTIPVWFMNMPDDENNFYASGVGNSSNPQLAIDKAILNAKRAFADRLDGTLSSNIKSFDLEEGGVATNNIEHTTINTIIDANLSGYSVKDVSIQLVNEDEPTYRIFVLLEYNSKTSKLLRAENRTISQEKALVIRSRKAFRDIALDVENKRAVEMRELE